MIILNIALVAVMVSLLAAVFQISRAPTPADKAVAADLMTFSVVALIALLGVTQARIGTFDLVLVATLVLFLSAVSLGRGLLRGGR